MVAIDDDSRGHVRYLHFKQGYSIRKIHHKTGISRKTVRNILADKPLNKTRIKGSKLDSYKDEITSILKEKPRISTVLLIEKLREKGYAGGKTIVYDYRFRLKQQEKPAYFHIETLAGDQAQVDWGHCGTISCGIHHRKLYVFCMTLSYSRYLFIEFTVSMEMETFLAAHIHGFHFFGGIPKSIVYDNLKSVVSRRVKQEIIFNAHYLDFARFYNFSPRVCNVRKPHEKGKVERAVDYVKRNFLARGPYENFDHIRFESKNWLKNIANQRLHSVTRKVPAEAFANEEKHLLQPLPPSDYDYTIPHTAPVNSQCLVNFQTNKYSVPHKYAGKIVALKTTTTDIKIYSDNQPIASHHRCYDKYQFIKNEDHYRGLLNQKRKAESSAAIETFVKLSAESKPYLSGLLIQQKNVHYHIKKILELSTLFGKTSVGSAIAKALEHQAFHWEYIKNIILESGSYHHHPVVSTKHSKEIMDLDVEQPDLSRYDQFN
jgi:transposase